MYGMLVVLWEVFLGVGGLVFVLFCFLERVHLLLVVVNRIANISNMIGRITPGVHSISN